MYKHTQLYSTLFFWALSIVKYSKTYLYFRILNDESSPENSNTEWNAPTLETFRFMIHMYCVAFKWAATRAFWCTLRLCSQWKRAQAPRCTLAGSRRINAAWMSGERKRRMNRKWETIRWDTKADRGATVYSADMWRVRSGGRVTYVPCSSLRIQKITHLLIRLPAVL